MGICRQVVVAIDVLVVGIIGPCCSAESAEEEERLNGDVPGGVRKGEEVGDGFCHDLSYPLHLKNTIQRVCGQVKSPGFLKSLNPPES